MAVPKTAALPLGYTPTQNRAKTGKEGIEPPLLSLEHRILAIVLFPPDMSASGLEPETNGLKGRCSTIELRARTLWVD
jgi:hypothetical protein